MEARSTELGPVGSRELPPRACAQRFKYDARHCRAEAEYYPTYLCRIISSTFRERPGVSRVQSMSSAVGSLGAENAYRLMDLVFADCKSYNVAV